MSSVEGTVKAQNIQNFSCITGALSHFSNGVANRAAKNVPGRKAIVMRAIVFMDELSRLDASAIVFWSFARPMLRSASSFAMRLNSLKLYLNPLFKVRGI